MRIYFQGDLHNFHLTAMPMRGRHTREYHSHRTAKLLDEIAPCWRRQLLGVTSDGAPTVTDVFMASYAA